MQVRTGEQLLQNVKPGQRGMELLWSHMELGRISAIFVTQLNQWPVNYWKLQS